MDPLTYASKVEEAEKLLDADDPTAAADLLQEVMKTKFDFLYRQI